MHDLLLKIYIQYELFVSREDGQDLVEYSLVVAMVAFGAVAGMSALSTGINTAFKTVSSKLLANV